jgi:alpha-galactosidase
MIGQSNMEGHGQVSPGTTKGTLEYTVLNDPGSNYQFLVTSGTNWVVRDDVWIHYERLTDGLRTGNLTPGYGAAADNNKIGPELGFGHSIGNTLSNQVLLVKAAWGGRSLGNDFLPPSSGANLAAAREWGDPGFYYKETLRVLNDAIAKLGTYFTNYDGKGYELAGICWHQGWNDRVSTSFSAAYQTNLANFIRDIRSKEYGLDVPNLPFVIATTGMDGLTNYTQVELAQLAMTNAVLYPEFVGNVAVVNTRTNYAPLNLDFWQPSTSSPKDENYHWNWNAKTYLHIGLAMGNEMPRLNSPSCPSRLRAAGGSSGVRLTWQNGTNMPTSVQVLRDGVEIAAAAPVSPATYLDATVLPGIHVYQLVFSIPGGGCGALTVTNNSSITGLTAYRGTNGVVLTWKNNLAYSGIQIQRNGTNIQAAYSGIATSYEDTAAPATGLITYSVVPTTGTGPAATNTIDLGPHDTGGAVIYEPFDLAAPSSLHGKTPSGTGLSGTWTRSAGSSANEMAVGAVGMTYGSLPVAGNFVKNSTTSGTRAAYIMIGNSLTNSGLLADGATLWFSVLVRPVTGANATAGFGLADGIATYYNSAVNAVGINIQNGADLEYWSDAGGTYSRVVAKGNMSLNIPYLVVGKLVWGTNGGNNTFELFLPDENLNQGSRVGTRQTNNLVQTQFDRLVIYNQGGGIQFDEIRFGASYAAVIGAAIDTSGDLTPPSPAQMTWAVAPYAISDSAIAMTAVTASDANGVEYLFTETSGNPGGASSGWQSSSSYTNSGLVAGTQYGYIVQARDKSVNQNTNVPSAPAALATTFPPDTNAPPPPAFAVLPTAISATQIRMTVSAVSDPEGSGVQYRFNNITLGTNSGWQSGTSYTNSGLAPSTTYSYTVQSRDLSANTNTSAASASQSATTLAVSLPPGPLIYEPFDMTNGPLAGQPGGTGLGTWGRIAGTAGSNEMIASTNGMIYGTLPTTGLRIKNQTTGSGRANNVSIGTTLSAAGLLADGATLWFSVLVEPVTSANATSGFLLANGNVTSYDTTNRWGVGINIQNGSDLEYCMWTNMTTTAGYKRSVAQADLHNVGGTSLGYRPHFVVGKLVWGVGGSNDTFELYMPSTNLTLGSIKGTAQSFNVDQSTFNRICIYNSAGGIQFDEIRFGASYNDVITAVAAASDYSTWAALYSPVNLTDPNADYDGDGLSNEQERVWGLNPTNAVSRHIFTFTASLGSGSFTYTRRDPALTGLTYSVWTSTNLVNWVQDTGAVQTPGTTVNQVQPVSVSVSSGLLTQPKLFIQMRVGN